MERRRWREGVRRQLRHCVLNLERRHLLRDVRLRLLQRDLRVRMGIDWLSDRNGLLIIGHLSLLLVSELLVVLLPHVKFDWKLLYHPPPHPTSSSIHKRHQKCTIFNDVVLFSIQKFIIETECPRHSFHNKTSNSPNNSLRFQANLLPRSSNN